MSEAMLCRSYDVVFCILHDTAGNNMLHDLACNAHERDRSIVFSVVTFSLLENESDECHPVCRVDTTAK